METSSRVFSVSIMWCKFTTITMMRIIMGVAQAEETITGGAIIGDTLMRMKSEGTSLLKEKMRMISMMMSDFIFSIIRYC